MRQGRVEPVLCLQSPLFVSADLERIPAASLALLTNPEVIAVSQDPLGKPGDLIYQEGPYQAGLARMLSYPGLRCLIEGVS